MGLQIRAKVDGVQLGANRAGRNDKITLTVQGIPINVLVELTKRYKQNVVLELVEVEQPNLFDDDGEPNHGAELSEAGRFWIDEGSFPIHADEEGEYRLTGKELRELVDGAEQLWQIDHDEEEGDARILVEDTALISLHDGDRFTVLEEGATAVDGEGLDLNRPMPIGAAAGRGAE